MLILRPTAGITELDAVPNLALAWQELLQLLTDYMLLRPLGGRERGLEQYSALEELKAWGRDRRDLRYYNPVTTPWVPGSTTKNVHWGARPTRFDQDPRFGGDLAKLFKFLDTPQPTALNSGVQVLMREQDEYCEWVVHNDGAKIRKIIFTSEPSLLYEFLFDPLATIRSLDRNAPDPEVDRDRSRELLVEMYKRRTGDNSITLADLVDADDNYNPFNDWNNRFAVHLQQLNNSLEAEVNIAVRASLLRAKGGTGPIKTDAGDLIKCAGYGEAARQSDPNIGAGVNSFVRQNRPITLADPIGLYMTGLDTTGWTAPDGIDPQELWKPLIGTADIDPDKAMIARAEFAPLPGMGFTVSDVKVGPNPIKFGAQIAEGIGMRVAAMVGPVSTLPVPRPIGCIRGDTLPGGKSFRRPTMMMGRR